MSGQVRPGQVKPGQLRPRQARSAKTGQAGQDKPSQARPEQVQARPGLVWPSRVRRSPAKSSQAMPSQVKRGRAQSGPAESAVGRLGHRSSAAVGRTRAHSGAHARAYPIAVARAGAAEVRPNASSAPLGLAGHRCRRSGDHRLGNLRKTAWPTARRAGPAMASGPARAMAAWAACAAPFGTHAGKSRVGERRKA